MTTLGILNRDVRCRLADAGIENAALDARLLVEHFSGTTRTEAIADPGREIGKAAAEAVEEALRRRLAGEPVHRIVGFREFFGLKLELSPETLEPRPDTETLVDLVLPFARQTAERLGTCRILDLGTGTGAIALALLSQVPEAEAVGTDISAGALAMADANADLNGVGDRFRTIVSDWFTNVNGRFHLIVSNPPYIRSGMIAALPAEVRLFDPVAALDGGNDGLDAYRVIAAAAGEHLGQEGRIAVEIGYDQREDVSKLFMEEGYRAESATRDLAGHDRALMFSR
jgi:release factor glutamine methyltransferase